MYLVERKPRRDGELRLECAVLGSVGNVYNVVIAHRPTCTCPGTCPNVIADGRLGVCFLSSEEERGKVLVSVSLCGGVT